MKLATRAGFHTFEDFCFLIKNDQKADLIDGIIHMASPENTDANELFVWMICLINLYVKRKHLGKVYGSRVAFKLDDTNSPEPDIAFVAKSGLHRVRRGNVQGAPDLAVEIVSPDSVERDYDKKRRQYERFGVAEYWIVDELEKKVTVLHLNNKGKYGELKPRRGECHSRVLPGFWVRAAWLWEEPRPMETEVLAEILSRTN